MLLEVCVDSFKSAQDAVSGGADRLEICGALGSGGGISPSFALVRQIRRSFSIPLMVMVRPRVGDFVYSELELELMEEEIGLLKGLGVEGIVVGCLWADGRIDVAATTRLVRAAAPMEVTFHRAFDMIDYTTTTSTSTHDNEALKAHSIVEGIKDLLSIPGITRLLTSGLTPTVSLGLPLLHQSLNPLPPSSLIILPGSGLSPTTLLLPSPPYPTLLARLRAMGVKEVHASCSTWVEGPVEVGRRREGMGMGFEGREWGRWMVREGVVREMKRLLEGGG